MKTPISNYLQRSVYHNNDKFVSYFISMIRLLTDYLITFVLRVVSAENIIFIIYLFQKRVPFFDPDNIAKFYYYYEALKTFSKCFTYTWNIFFHLILICMYISWIDVIVISPEKFTFTQTAFVSYKNEKKKQMQTMAKNCICVCVCCA